MQTEQTHTAEIRAAFEKMQTKEDLLNLLNLAKPMVYGSKAFPFILKQLTYYTSLKPLYNLDTVSFTIEDVKDIIAEDNINPVIKQESISKSDNKFNINDFLVKERNHRYRSFTVKKKSGSLRTIHAPVKGLKAIQKTLAFILQCVFEPHKAAMGFVRDKSIVDNARLHEGNRYVYNIDLKDFFPSIDQARFWKCLQLGPFNLTSEKKREFDIEKDLKDGYGTFLTNEGEIIHYRINNGRKELLKTKGDYERYEKRFISSNANITIREIFRIRQLALKGDEDAQKTEIRIREDMFKREEEKRQMKKDAKFFIINNEKQKFAKSSPLNIANIIASLCCTEMEVERKNANCEWEKVKRNVLPQGAPTSPVITNIICQRLDYLLSAVAKRFGLKYSRYADDITFSSMHNVYQPDGDFLTELHRIIADQGFHIKESKTRLQKDGYRKEVTGLLVNEKANVQQRYIKQLRMWLYYWERYGYERASGFFLQEYFADKGHVKKGKPDMANVIAGKLDYLKMVKGNENQLYLKLKGRFDALIMINEKVSESPLIHIENLLLPTTINIIPDSIESASSKSTNKLRINISPLGLENVQIKLKRKIFYDVGTSVPFVEEINNQKLEIKEIDLSKHKPLDTNLFLIRFKSSNGLKFLTHKYDIPPSLFDYKEILRIAREEFDELTKQLVIPDRLKARVFQFAFGIPSKSWFFNGIRHNTNWQSPILLKWMESNPHIHPIQNDEFEKGLIYPFKRSIEIASPQLEELFTRKLAENLKTEYTDFVIKTIDLDKASFYTDVDAFQTGIGILINSIKQRSSKSKSLKIEFKRKSEEGKTKRVIRITHLNSICDKPLDRKELLKGDLLQAEEAFLGICDWSIISNSSVDKVNKLNILFDINTKIEARQTIDSTLIEGFTHELTFYS